MQGPGVCRWEGCGHLKTRGVHMGGVWGCAARGTWGSADERGVGFADGRDRGCCGWEVCG